MYTFRGKQGIQGVQGPAGESTFALTTVIFDPETAVTSKELDVFASASKTGTVTFWGQLSIDASALNSTTITPMIDGVAVSTCISKATTPSGQFDSIPICGIASITAGQTFTIDVAVTGGGTIDINTGSLTYVLQ